jgi:hypothetical protein
MRRVISGMTMVALCAAIAGCTQSHVPGLGDVRAETADHAIRQLESRRESAELALEVYLAGRSASDLIESIKSGRGPLPYLFSSPEPRVETTLVYDFSLSREELIVDVRLIGVGQTGGGWTSESIQAHTCVRYTVAVAEASELRGTVTNQVVVECDEDIATVSGGVEVDLDQV